MAELKFWYAFLVSFFVLGLFVLINFTFQPPHEASIVNAAPLTIRELKAKNEARNLKKIEELLVKLKELMNNLDVNITGEADARESIFKIVHELEGLDYNIYDLDDPILRAAYAGERTLLERAISRIPQSEQSCFQNSNALIEEIEGNPLAHNEILSLNNEIDKAQIEIDVLKGSLEGHSEILNKLEQIKVLEGRDEAYYLREARKIESQGKYELDVIIKRLKKTDEVNIGGLKDDIDDLIRRLHIKP